MNGSVKMIPSAMADQPNLHPLDVDISGIVTEFGTTDIPSEQPEIVLEQEGLTAAFREIEIERRRLVARECWVLARLDDTKLTGHRSARELVFGRFQWSQSEYNQRIRIARAGREHPDILHMLAEGDLPIGHAERLSLHLIDNPNLTDRPRFDHELAHWLRKARFLEYDIYRRKLTEWGNIADPESTETREQQQHHNRKIRIRQRDDGMYEINGQLPEDVGALIVDRWGQQIDVEFEIDWRQSDQGQSELSRTNEQRQADAFVKLLLGDAHTSIEAGTVIVVDQQTLEQALGTLATGDQAEPNESIHPDVQANAEWVDPSHRHCRTASGHPISTRMAAQHFIRSWFRLAIVDASQKLVATTSKQRSFTGANAEVLKALDTRCIWPGCRAPARRCHIDHNEEHHRGGPTALPNTEGLLCGPHNNIKHELELIIVRHPNGMISVIDRAGTIVA